MKQPLPAFLLLIACCAAVPHASSQELPLFGQIPQPGREWTLREKGAPQKGIYQYSWATFTNSKTGDILSFVADQWTNVVRKVGDSPVQQAATDMFPGGYPRGHMRTPTQPIEPSDWLIDEVLRFHVVTLQTGVEAGGRKKLKAEALEYSYVYELRTKALPNRLAHGYVVAFGATVIFIQHTSTNIIASYDVNSIALSLIQNHPSSRPKQ